MDYLKLDVSLNIAWVAGDQVDGAPDGKLTYNRNNISYVLQAVNATGTAATCNEFFRYSFDVGPNNGAHLDLADLMNILGQTGKHLTTINFVSVKLLGNDDTGGTDCTSIRFGGVSTGPTAKMFFLNDSDGIRILNGGGNIWFAPTPLDVDYGVSAGATIFFVNEDTNSTAAVELIIAGDTSN